MLKSTFMALSLVAAMTAFTAARAQTAASQPAAACHSEKCKSMKGCCQADDHGKLACAMDFKCCDKPADGATSKPAGKPSQMPADHAHVHGM
jgi:hypothetical protein